MIGKNTHMELSKLAAYSITKVTAHILHQLMT